MIPRWLKQYALKRIRTLQYDVAFHDGVFINAKSTFGGRNTLYKNVQLLDSHLGRASYIGNNSSIYSTTIGKYCSIGPNVTCAIGRHPTSEWVSSHPAFFSVKRQAGFTFCTNQRFPETHYADIERMHSINIGNDVWIGANAVLLDGVSIGNGAIIAAGCVVHKDVEPYAIVAGSPMITLRKRFNEQDCLKLNEMQWWDFDDSLIESLANDFKSIDEIEESLERFQSKMIIKPHV